MEDPILYTCPVCDEATFECSDDEDWQPLGWTFTTDEEEEDSTRQWVCPDCSPKPDPDEIQKRVKTLRGDARKKTKRNGGGVIEYRHPPDEDGKQDITYRIQWRQGNRQIKKTLGRKSEGWNRTLAKQERQKELGKVAEGHVRPEAVLFSVYAKQWFEQAQLYESYADNTLRAYKTEMEKLVKRFGSWKTRDLTSLAINRYSSELLAGGQSPATVRRMLAVWNLITKRAVEDGVIEAAKRPAPRLPAPPESNPRHLTREETRIIEEELAAEKDPQVLLVAKIAGFLGMRLGEIQSLRWRDVSFEEQVLRITKSKTRKGLRSLFIYDDLLEALKVWHETTKFNRPDNLVVCNQRTGSKWRSDRGYSQAFHRGRIKAGIDQWLKPCHVFRVSAITEAHRLGISNGVIQDLFGHESFQTTQGYIDSVGYVYEEAARAIGRSRSGLHLVKGGEAEEAALVQEAAS